MLNAHCTLPEPNASTLPEAGPGFLRKWGHAEETGISDRGSGVLLNSASNHSIKTELAVKEMGMLPAALGVWKSKFFNIRYSQRQRGKLSITHSAQPELEWSGKYSINHSNLCLRNCDAQL